VRPAHKTVAAVPPISTLTVFGGSRGAEAGAVDFEDIADGAVGNTYREYIIILYEQAGQNWLQSDRGGRRSTEGVGDDDWNGSVLASAGSSTLSCPGLT
jgi:hypothetical protein